jgi:hypothetical protein
MKKNVSSLILFVLLLFVAQLSLAQDPQTLYEDAKKLLKAGDYQGALNRISAAKREISQNPKLDPNKVFSEELLPKVEKSAQNMATVAKELEELYNRIAPGAKPPEAGLDTSAVNQYRNWAKNIIGELTTQRDTILARYELDPEYREALRNAKIYKQIERFSTVELVDKLSDKFLTMVTAFTDSLSSIDKRYKSLEKQIAELEKSLTESQTAQAASADELKKLKRQRDKVGTERAKYMNAISDMLASEMVGENVKVKLTQSNVDDVLTGLINGEIKRVSEIQSVDPAGKDELMRSLAKIKNYNRVMTANGIAKDKSDLISQYEAVINKVQVIQPVMADPTFWFKVAIGVLVLLILVLIIVVMRKGKGGGTAPAQPQP